MCPFFSAHLWFVRSMLPAAKMRAPPPCRRLANSCRCHRIQANANANAAAAAADAAAATANASASAWGSYPVPCRPSSRRRKRSCPWFGQATSRKKPRNVIRRPPRGESGGESHTQRGADILVACMPVDAESERAQLGVPGYWPSSGASTGKYC